MQNRLITVGFISFFLLWVVKKLCFIVLLSILTILLFGPEILIVLVSALVVIAFYVVLERKFIGSIQRRRGPNVVGFWGLLQALADGLKLIVKEVSIPSRANRVVFIIAPILSIVISLAVFFVLPISAYTNVNVVDTPVDILILFSVSSFGVYGIVLSGWSSNSKYAFLGSLRSAAQMISYEVFFSLVILVVLLLAKSANFVDIVLSQYNTVWYIVPCLPLAVVFFIAILAETNRTPFDLPEAEAEIVAGYNVEYSSILFALFFLGEYGNIFALSYLFTLLFLGGWLPPVCCVTVFHGFWAGVKALIVAVLFIIVRGNLPRYRYDQLIGVGWKVFLPFVFSYFILFVAFITLI